MNLQNELDKQANLWIIKENEGLSKNEKEELNTWLENKTNKEVYNKNKQFVSRFIPFDEEFMKELDEEVKDEINTFETKQKSFFFKYKYIAASIIMTCVFIFAALEVNKYYEPTFVKTYKTKNEKIINIVLPDSSSIDLDIKSKMNIVYYNTKRTVELLEGKAFFAVAKDKEKPFLIKSNNNLIEVLGTKFEVINSNNTTKVNVFEGLVRINHIYNSNGDIKAIRQLSKEDSFLLNNKGKVISFNKIDTNTIASWKNDIINFNKTTLKDASLIFERYANLEIQFDNYDLTQLKISGKFSTLHYESFFEAIKVIYKLEVQKQGNLIKISKK